MSSANEKLKLFVECEEECKSGYIFINKQYKFNICLKTQQERKLKLKNIKSTNNKSYLINILCVDNKDRELDSTEYSLSTSSINLTLNSDSKCPFKLSISKLSMHHGNNHFKLQFKSNNNDIIPSNFIAIRVINYKFRILSSPRQLMQDNYKFYKDVKPKTNFLNYKLGLINSFGNIMSPSSIKPHARIVPIKCLIYFENNTLSPNQSALNLRGITSIYNEQYKLLNNGTINVPIRIEETSTKYDNKKFKIKFIADSTQITANLDIAPCESKPFLVRTKINKYRLKNKIMPYAVPSFIMPPLFATAPGMNMIQIDSINNNNNNDNNKKRRRKRILEVDDDNIDRFRPPHKKQRVTRSQTSSNGLKASKQIQTNIDNDDKYIFNYGTDHNVLEPLIIESLRILGECMGRREYFVSGTECHCYLKCLYCGSTAYPPRENHIKHNNNCMLSVLYHNMTAFTPIEYMAKAFHFNMDNNNNNNSLPCSLPLPPTVINNNNNKFNISSFMAHAPPPATATATATVTTRIPLPPISKSIINNSPPLTATPTYDAASDDIDIDDHMNMNIDNIRSSSTSFSLVRSDKCNSFNGFIGPFNSLILAPNINNNNNSININQKLSLSPNLNKNNNNRNGSFSFIPVSFSNPPPRNYPLGSNISISSIHNNNNNNNNKTSRGYAHFPQSHNNNSSSFSIKNQNQNQLSPLLKGFSYQNLSATHISLGDKDLEKYLNNNNNIPKSTNNLIETTKHLKDIKNINIIKNKQQK